LSGGFSNVSNLPLLNIMVYYQEVFTNNHIMKLSPTALGLAGGIMWALIVCILTLTSIWTGGYATEVLNLIGNIYPGYQITVWGAFVGLVYGFIDGFLGGYILAWVYNIFAKKT